MVIIQKESAQWKNFDYEAVLTLWQLTGGERKYPLPKVNSGPIPSKDKTLVKSSELIKERHRKRLEVWKTKNMKEQQQYIYDSGSSASEEEDEVEEEDQDEENKEDPDGEENKGDSREETSMEEDVDICEENDGLEEEDELFDEGRRLSKKYLMKENAQDDGEVADFQVSTLWDQGKRLMQELDDAQEIENSDLRGPDRDQLAEEELTVVHDAESVDENTKQKEMMLDNEKPGCSSSGMHEERAKKEPLADASELDLGGEGPITEEFKVDNGKSILKRKKIMKKSGSKTLGPRTAEIDEDQEDELSSKPSPIDKWLSKDLKRKCTEQSVASKKSKGSKKGAGGKKGGGKSFRQKTNMERLTVELDSIVRSHLAPLNFEDIETDTLAVALLPSDVDGLSSSCRPLQCEGFGNCLFNAVSILLCAKVLLNGAEKNDK